MWQDLEKALRNVAYAGVGVAALAVEKAGEVGKVLVEKGEIEKMMDSPSLYKCLSCSACVERCPRGVEPAKVVEAVRLLVIRQQGCNHMTPDQIPALLDEDLPQQAIVSAMRKYSK